MAERPIIMSGESVRAILDGRKTQTRRVIKPKPTLTPCGLWSWRGKLRGTIHHECGGTTDVDGWQPPIAQGDRLWVKERCRAAERTDGLDGVVYLADGDFVPIANTAAASERWMVLLERSKQHAVSPIYMPKWAARIWLDVTGVRVGRVQEISIHDAVAEGVKLPVHTTGPRDPIYAFRDQWDRLNRRRGFGWEENPWVWVIEFKVTR